MSWWDEKIKGRELVVGDEPLDALSESLGSIAQLYEMAWGRKPTAAELARLVELVLAGDGENVCSDALFHEVQIASVLKKRSVRQSFKIGDYFAVELDRQKFAYGRILWDHPSYGPLVETFDFVSDGPAPLRQVKAGKRLFCTYVSEDGFRSRRWRIIGFAPVVLKQNQLPILSRVGSAGGDLMQGQERLRRTTREEAEQYYPEALESVEAFERHLRETLRDGRTYLS